MNNCHRISLMIGLTAVLLGTGAYAIHVERLPHPLVQPNGQDINCFLTGDEFHRRLHDDGNFTIIQDPQTGYYVYAQANAEGLVATSCIVGRDDPRQAGLAPGADLPAAVIKNLRSRFPYMAGEGNEAPPTGTINNLVVYIRFADQAEFTDSIAYYNRMFNNSTSGASSMYNYFIEASYNALTVSSTFYPTPGSYTVSYQDSHNRNYFIPYDSVANPEG